MSNKISQSPSNYNRIMGHLLLLTFNISAFTIKLEYHSTGCILKPHDICINGSDQCDFIPGRGTSDQILDNWTDFLGELFRRNSKPSEISVKGKDYEYTDK